MERWADELDQPLANDRRIDQHAGGLGGLFDFAGQYAGVIRALDPRGRHHPLDDIEQPNRQVGAQRLQALRSLVGRLEQHLGDRAFVRGRPGRETVEHRAQPEDVGGRVRGLIMQDFRRDVAGCSDDLTVLCQCFVGGQRRARDAEVRNARAAVVAEQQVPRCYVAVHKLQCRPVVLRRAVDVRQSAKSIEKHAHDRFGRRLSVTQNEHVGDRADVLAANELGRDVELIVDHPHVDGPHHVFVMQAHRKFSFMNEALAHRRDLREVRAECLDGRERILRPRRSGGVNLGHAPTADHPHEHERPERLAALVVHDAPSLRQG